MFSNKPDKYKSAIFILFAIIVLFVTACGSNSGSNPGTGTPQGLSTADLVGNYHLAGQQLLDAVNPATTEVWSWTGIMNFDGAGGCSYTGTNETGVRRTETVSPPTLEYKIGDPNSNTCSYSLEADGTLTFGSGAKYYVSADLNTLVGVYGPGTVETLIKQSNTSLNNASLTGTYQFTALHNILTTTTTEDNAVIASVTFDGAGNCIYAESVNNSKLRTENVVPRVIESVQGTLGNANCSYDLAADGTLSINGSARYAVGVDSNIIIGIDNAADVDMISVSHIAMVKNIDSGLTNASVQGKYMEVNLRLELYTDWTEAWTWGGVVEFDGAGGCSYTGKFIDGISRNESVDPWEITLLNVTPVNDTCSYDLTTDGILSINGIPTYFVSPDTNAIVGIDGEVGNTFVTSYFDRLVRLPK